MDKSDLALKEALAAMSAEDQAKATSYLNLPGLKTIVTNQIVATHRAKAIDAKRIIAIHINGSIVIKPITDLNEVGREVMGAMIIHHTHGAHHPAFDRDDRLKRVDLNGLTGEDRTVDCIAHVSKTEERNPLASTLAGFEITGRLVLIV